MAKTNEPTTKLPSIRSFSRNRKKYGATRPPITTTMTRKATALPVIDRRLVNVKPPSPPSVPATTARMMRPSTSSTTAAPTMVLASSVCSRCMSANTRAVIPTLVAVMAAPMKNATSVLPSPRLSKSEAP